MASPSDAGAQEHVAADTAGCVESGWAATGERVRRIFASARLSDALRERCAGAPAWAYSPGASLDAFRFGERHASPDVPSAWGNVVPVHRSVTVTVTGQGDVDPEDGPPSMVVSGRWVSLEASSASVRVTWKVVMVPTGRALRGADLAERPVDGPIVPADDADVPDGGPLEPVGSITAPSVSRFCAVVSDPNPIHHSALAARRYGFPDVVVPGPMLASLLLAAAGSDDALRPDGSFRATVRLRRWVIVDEPLALRRTGRRVDLLGTDQVCRASLQLRAGSGHRRGVPETGTP